MGRLNFKSGAPQTDFGCPNFWQKSKRRTGTTAITEHLVQNMANLPHHLGVCKLKSFQLQGVLPPTLLGTLPLDLAGGSAPDPCYRLALYDRYFLNHPIFHFFPTPILFVID